MSIKTKKMLIDPYWATQAGISQLGREVRAANTMALPGARPESKSGQLPVPSPPPVDRNTWIIREKLIGTVIELGRGAIAPKPKGSAPKVRPGGGLKPQTTVATVPTKKVWNVPTLPEVPMGSVTDLFSNIVSGITDYQVAKVSQPNNPFIPDILEFGWAGAPTTSAEVVIDNTTGQVLKVGPCGKRRRRRRRLATASDLKDLAALKAILGGGKSLDTWLATRGRR